VNNVFSAAGTSAAEVGIDVLLSKGVYYKGLFHLGNGAPLSSLLWGMLAIFSIQDRPMRGAIVACIASLLSLTGIIHSAQVQFANSELMPFVWAYLMIAAIFLYKHFTDRNNPGNEKPASAK
jgi:adenine/guanine/hypoxanthine permease